MISIIVPVYNVEDYLDQCIKSILDQTYSDWELILIDDGSTDKSPQICDYYVEVDKRIQVIHTENRGQAAARNIGIEKSNGDFITFCDSDDWLEKEFLLICYENISYYNADIVTTNYYYYYSDEKKYPVFKKQSKKITVMSNEEGMLKLMKNDGASSSVCARLYKKEIFNNIRFSEGTLFEDAGVSYKFFMKANRIVLIDEPLMFYRQREGSTMSKRNKGIRLDELNASVSRYKAVRKKYDYDISEAAFSNLVYDMIHVKECFIRDGYNTDELKKYEIYIKTELRKNNYKYDRNFSLRKKSEAIMLLKCPYLFEIIVSIIARFEK